MENTNKKIGNANRQKKLRILENKLRKMVREELVSAHPRKNKLNELYDDSGEKYDILQEKLYGMLTKSIQTWAETKALPALKKYAALMNKTDEDAIDEDVLISEFFRGFEDYNMWEEIVGKYM